MTRLDRYVLRNLLFGMIMVTFGLSSVVWLTQSLRFVDLIVNRGLPAETMLRLTLLVVPGLMGIVLPIALFTVVVFTYSRLINDRELVVMRAAGLGPMDIARPALILAGLIVVVGYALTTYLSPRANQVFGEMQWDIRYAPDYVMIQEGEFTRVANGVTAYVRERNREGRLFGILVHDGRQANRPITFMAEQGALVKTETGARVLMINGSRQEREPGTNAFSMLYFDAYTLDLLPHLDKPATRYRKPFERTVWELFHFKDDPNVQQEDYNRFRGELHKRLASPLYALAFTVVALAWLMAGGFNRNGQGARIAGAVASLIGLQLSFLGLENLAGYRPALAPLLYLAVAATTAGGGWVLVRQLARRPRAEMAVSGEPA